MSRNLVVMKFDEKNPAYEAVSAVKKANESGDIDIKLYTGQIVSKDEKGNIEVSEDKGRGLHATAGGAAVGLLLGALGGVPVALVGAMLGSMFGLTTDAIIASVDQSFVNEVVSDLNPGETLLVAEINEGSTSFVDDIAREYGATISRTLISSS